MAFQEVWVHGCGGVVDFSRLPLGWGSATYRDAGLVLQAQVEEIIPAYSIPSQGAGPASGTTTWGPAFPQVGQQTTRDVFVYYHVPTPTSLEAVARIRKVMVRFSTDYDPPGPDPEFQSAYGLAQYVKGWGGAVIGHVQVMDAERHIGTWIVNWSTQGILNFLTQSRSIHETPVNNGVGVILRLTFKNQEYEQKLLSPDSSHPLPRDPDWDGKPWLNEAAATQFRRAFITSVGCEFRLGV